MIQHHSSLLILKIRMAMMQTSQTQFYLHSLYLTDIRSKYPLLFVSQHRSTLCRSSTPYQLHNEEIVNHLYHAGFQTGVGARVPKQSAY